MEAVTHLTTENFDELVLGSDRPVVVDFWAPWCGPCRIVAPVIERLAAEHPEIRVAKLNVDEAPDIAARFGVRSIPTIGRFEGGELVAQVVGALPYERLAETLGVEAAAIRAHAR